MVDVSVQRQGSDALFIVEDSGPGIPPAQRAHVMRRFHRSTSDERSSKVQGSGLGLAIVDAIARAHGASISLETAPVLGGLRVVLRMACLDNDLNATTADHTGT